MPPIEVGLNATCPFAFEVVVVDPPDICKIDCFLFKNYNLYLSTKYLLANHKYFWTDIIYVVLR